MKSFLSSRFKPLIRLPYLPIILAPVILFAPSLFTGKALFWGLPALQFIPWRAYAWESLLSGLLPLWNPLNGLGAPLIANYQLAFFYPPGWIVYLFMAIGGIQLMAWSHTLLVVLHLIWAGIGMAYFTRSLGLGVLAQTISGLAFGLCGYLVARSSFYSMVWAAAWLPWILYSVTRVVQQEESRFSFKLLIFVSLQLLAGHAQLTWYTLLLSGVWAGAYSWTAGGYKKCLRVTLIFLASVAASVLLTSIQLFPTAEFLLQSQRSSAVDYELGLTYSYWPWRLLTLLSPDFFGNPGNGTYFGYAAYWEDAAYIGLIPFVLALSTLGTALRRKQSGETGRRPMVIFWWVIILAGFILALGKNLPIFPFLYKYVPTFGLFNAPARWMIWVVTALCVLAGYGAESWRKPVGKAIRRYRTAAVIAFAVAFGAGLAWIALREVRLTFIQATAISGAWGLVFCLLTLRMPQADQDQTRWRYIAAGLIAIDLISAQLALIPTADSGLFIPPPQTDPPVAQGQRVYLSYTDEYTLKFQRFFRIADFNPLESWNDLWQVMLPDTNLTAGIAYVNNFDPLLPGRYATLINYLDKLPADQRTDFLKILDVGANEVIDPTLSSGVRFTPVQGNGRFQWAGCAINAKDDADALKKTIDSIHGLVNGQVVIEGGGTDQPCDSTGKAAIQVITDNPLQTSVTVTAGAAGWLVMADTWYPGWEAMVDGNPTPILHADYLLRGVSLQKGQHQVDIIYRPQWFTLGAVFTIAGWIAVFITGLFLTIRFNKRIKL